MKRFALRVWQNKAVSAGVLLALVVVALRWRIPR